VHVCSGEITLVGKNQWYGVLTENARTEETFTLSSVALRTLLQTQAELQGRPLLDNSTFGIVPWCGWCQRSELLDMHLSLPVNFSRALNAPRDNEATAIAYLDLLGRLDELFPDLATFKCIVELLDQLLPAAQAMRFFNLDGSPAPVLECLTLPDMLPEDRPPECLPCGVPETMSIDVVRNSTGNVTAFRDQLSNLTFPVEEVSRLIDRCAFELIRNFLQLCVPIVTSTLDPGYGDISKLEFRNALFSDDDPLISVPKHEDSVFLTPLTTPSSNARDLSMAVPRVAQGEPALLAAADNSVGQAIGQALGGIVSNAESFWGDMVNQLQRSFIEGGELFARVGGTCRSEFLSNPMDLVALNPRSLMSLERDISAGLEDEDRLRSIGACWGLYAMYFSRRAGCLDSLLPATSTGDVNQTVLETLALEFILVNLLGSEDDFTPLPRQTTYADGYPSRPVFSGGQMTNLTVASWFPLTVQEFDDRLGGCVQSLDEAPAALDEFLDFLSSLAECNAPTTQLKGSLAFQGALFIVAILMLVLQVSWMVRGHITALTVSSLLALLGLICITNGSYFFFGWHDTSLQELKLSVFFNQPERNKNGFFDYRAIIRAFGLGFFFLQHVLVLRHLSVGLRTSLGHRQQAAMLGQMMPFVMAAVAFVAVRGFVGWFVLLASTGWIPLVNWISVIRICMSETTNDFPRCNSPDLEAEKGLKPFFGNLVVTLIDIGILLLARQEGARCRREISKHRFEEARNQLLIFNLKRVLDKAFGICLLCTAILYTSLIEITVGYNGYFEFDTDGATVRNVSLSFTGVQDWEVGFVLILFVYCAGWLGMLMPTNTWFMRLFLKTIPPSEKHVAFYTCDSEIQIDGKGSSVVALRDQVAFDSNSFVLHDQLQSMLMTTSIYHIGVKFQSGKGVLPEHMQELAYVSHAPSDTHVWIVADRDRVFITFRGTTSATNAKTDLRMQFTTLDWLQRRKAAGAHDAIIRTPDGQERQAESRIDVESGSGNLSAGKQGQHHSGTWVRSGGSGSVNLQQRLQVQAARTVELYGQEVEDLVQTAVKSLDNFERRSNANLPKIHKGFLLAFNAVQLEILQVLAPFLEAHPEITKIVACGHSLGGALATLCGAFLGAAMPRKLVQVSTFGSPRVGNFLFKRHFDSLVSSCWRFVKVGDPITRTPIQAPCTRIGYKHVGIEILAAEKGEIVIDPTLVEHALLHRFKSGGISHHKLSAYMMSLYGFALQAVPRDEPSLG
ncbi:Lipase (RDL) (Triacylglycerol lipase) (ROL), partial [Durusdinium trenchii]